LEQLPALERVRIAFHANLYPDLAPHVVTLPHVQEMSLSTFNEAGVQVHLPHILEFLHLPKLTLLCVQAIPRLIRYHPLFPVTPFGKHLPNLAELPELQVNMGMSSGEVTFRSPSQAALKYLTGPLSDYDTHEHTLWRELPLHSVRRLTVNMISSPFSQELEWFIELLGDLEFLEHLDIGGECGRALRWLRHEIAREAISPRLKTLTVRSGESERHQALVLKHLVNATGLDMTLICIPDPRVHEEGRVEADTDSSSDDWDSGSDGSG
jgi:hypothetical protein